MTENNKWRKVDHLMRVAHLYTGIFLAPWMLVYAASAFCLNHGPWMTKNLKITPPVWEVVRKVDFTPGEDFPHAQAEQAKAILQHLELDGAHRFIGQPNRNQMVLLRIAGGGNYRVTWRKQSGLLVVEKQPLSFYRLMHFLHFKGGYQQPYLAHILWAVVVDAVAVTMVFWVVSGIYIWARRPRKRLLGGICIAAGCLLFLLLVILLCT